MGGSKKVTVGYKYLVGVHMGLCHGPIDFISQFIVDDRIALQTHAVAGEVIIDAPGLFGGESREGGVTGALDLLMGGSTQLQNAYLQSVIGIDIPAFRGIVSVVLKQMNLGMNPYLKPWKFRAQRIHVRQNGIEQWYDAKAAIPITTAAELPADPAVYHVELDAIDTASSGGYGGSPPAVRLSGLSPSAVYLVTVREDGVIAWSNWSSDDNELADGNPWTSSVWVRRVEEGETQAGLSPYRPTAEEALAAFVPFTITGSATYDFFIQDNPLFDNRGGLSLTITQISGGTAFDMNPAHMVRECLTDPDWGMGYLEADVNDVAFMSAADRLYAELMGLSMLWDKQIPIEQFIKEILKHISASLYLDRSTGKFVLKLIRDDYVLADLITLDETNIISVENPVRPDFGELTNSVTIQYWDYATNKPGSLTVDDPALIAAQEATINTTVQYPGFTNAMIAGKAGGRDLRSLSSQLLACTIFANRIAARLNQGDAFIFTYPKLKVYGLVMRVTEIALGDGKTNRVRIKAVQDVFAVPDRPPVADPGGDGWVDPSAPPAPATLRSVFEAPYWELVQILGQSDADSKLASNPEVGFIAATCVRPANEINAIIAVDSGAGYEDTGALVDFCPTATIVGDITELDETFPIENGIDLEEIAIGSYAYLDDEIVRVDAVSDSSITVGRGVLDTTLRRHLAGARLFFVDVYLGSDGVEYVDGEEIGVKLLPVTGQGMLAIAAATEDLITMASRAARPYPPGQFKIEGEYYPTTLLPASITVTWVDRDRTQQTGGTLLDHTDAGVGPEDGVTYRIQVIDEDDVIQIDISGITGTSQLVDLAPMPTPVGTLRLYAERDGLLSWQPCEAAIFFVLDGLVVVDGEYVVVDGEYVIVT